MIKEININIVFDEKQDDLFDRILKGLEFFQVEEEEKEEEESAGCDACGKCQQRPLEHNGCEGCVYESVPENCEPCAHCKFCYCDRYMRS